MSSAMAKAALIGMSSSLYQSTASTGPTVGNWDVVSNQQVQKRPDVATGQGWGKVNLLDLTSTVTKVYLDGSKVQTGFLLPFTSSGQTRSQTFTISNSALPTQVVLAWPDEPANPATLSTRTLINDLNLRVYVPSCGNGYKFQGNFFNPDETSGDVCGFGIIKDNKNNVEMIQLPANSGVTTFTVEVFANSLGVGYVEFPNQPFSVYVENAQ
jgi:hypothetical protein